MLISEKMIPENNLSEEGEIEFKWFDFGDKMSEFYDK